jgi:hypothetical protein
MSLSIKELKLFYKEPKYLALQDALLSELHIAHSGELSNIVCKLDLQGLYATEIALSQVKDVLYQDYEKVEKYVLEKMRALRRKPVVQEYPENELPDEEDVAHEIASTVVVGAPRNFLFGHLMEYVIMSAKPERLTAYLKVNDIPYRGKYRKDLLEFFARSQNS